MKNNNIKRKRICFPFVGDSVGGSHKSALILIDKLNLKLFDPLIVLHKEGPFEDFLKKKNVKYKILKLKNIIGEKKGILSLLLTILKSNFKLIFFILKNNIKIIHTNDTGMHLTWAIPAFLTKKKLIWHLRNLYPKWNLFYFFSIFSSHILCISKFVQKSVPKLYQKKTHVIFNPINIKKIRKKNTFKFNCKKNIFVIGFIANLWKRKQPFKFLELAEKILKKRKNIFFVIAGADREITKAILKKKIKKKKLKSKIQLFDFLDPIEPLLKSIDLIFIPAVKEPFGRTLIESMSVKTPVIANKSGGHIEIIKDNFNGWLCDINNMKDTTNLVLKNINNKKYLVNIKRNAFSFVKKKFNSKNHVKNISYFYN